MQKHRLAGRLAAGSALAACVRRADVPCPQVEEMERTVNVAERQAARFGLSQQEVQSRRQWVQRTKQEVREPQEESLAHHSCQL